MNNKYVARDTYVRNVAIQNAAANATVGLGKFYVEVKSEGKRSANDFACWLMPKREELWTAKDRISKENADAHARERGYENSLYVPKTGFISQTIFWNKKEDAEKYMHRHFRRTEAHVCRFLGADYGLE